jgi:class 3 adenylate cyclase/predicted ATPase
MDLEEWLRSLGLERYGAIFRENAVDGDVLPELTEGDLEKLGIPLGDRKRLMRAIRVRFGDEPKLDRAPAQSSRSAAETRTLGAERRQLTILFCDLVGSTTLSTQLDHEDMREAVHGYHRCCTAVIGGYGGFVAKYMGDGVLAYFGYPQAHEDDAERAVSASLALVDQVGQLATPHGVALQVRIGIATGLVVVGDLIGEGAAQEQSVVGETPNLASRLQALAEPNQVVISHHTRRLVAGLFEYLNLGRVTLKGFNEPHQAWRVIRPSAVQSRFEAQHEDMLTPLVGREEELELLLRRWRQATAGEGRVVILTGEPGIGKSRLSAALQERLRSEPCALAQYFCSSQHVESPLFPVINYLERVAGFERSEPGPLKLAKLEALLARSGAGGEAIALIADMMSVPTDGQYLLPEMSPQRRKEKMLAALLAQLEYLTVQRPLLMVVEDIHWIDPTSLELVGLLVERAPQLRLLVVITTRPEFSSPWPNDAHIGTIGLMRLNRREAVSMMNRVAGGKHLPDEISDQILSRTDGVPLFLEELTKTVLEGGLLEERQDHYVLAQPLAELGIPTTLHASLMARLDRSVLVKEIAQIGAAIGRQFTYALLRAVSAMEESDLKEALSKLEEAELASCRGRPPEATYSFRHALVQDTAYSSLIRSRRKELHRQIAEALRDRFAALAESEPEIIAHHFTEAGLPALAIEWWSKAGEQSLKRSSIAEASSHLKRAISLAEQGAVVPAKDRLRLQVAYGQTQLAAKGFGAPETAAAFARARELVSGIEDTEERFSVYYGLWVGSYMRGELAPMRELSTAFLADVGQHHGLPEAASADRIVGVTRWVEGHFIEAKAHLEKAVAEAAPELDGALAFRFGQAPRIAAMLNLGLVLGPLDEIDRMQEIMSVAWSDAQKGGHIPTIAYAHGQTCVVEGLCGYAELIKPHAAALVALSREHGLQLWKPVASFFENWVHWRESRGNVNLDEMRTAHQQFHVGFQPIVSLAAVRLAEVEAEMQGVDSALALLDDALAEVQRTGQRWYDAEIHRQRGRFLLRDKHSVAGAARAAFESALGIARQQQARMFELRAATDLASLLWDQGQPAAARELLTPICTAPAATSGGPDFKAAIVLLDALP